MPMYKGFSGSQVKCLRVFQKNLFRFVFLIILLMCQKEQESHSLRIHKELVPEHLNGGGVCQGGTLFTLADMACVAAYNSHLILTLGTSAKIIFLWLMSARAMSLQKLASW